MSKNAQQNTESPNISLIGSGTTITGEVVTKGDIRIDGTVKGNLNVQGKIVLGNSGIIEGEIKSANADISGQIKGIMHVAESLSMKASSSIQGDIQVGKLSIEPGAVFIGNCKMGSNNSPLTNNQMNTAHSKDDKKQE